MTALKTTLPKRSTMSVQRTVSIEVEHLTCVYKPQKRGGEPVVANNDLTFTVYRGDIFGLLGANGAGKTTLLLQLLGLVKPTSGSIRIEGVDVATHGEAIKRITGFLPQTGIPMSFATVEQALHYTGRLRGQSEADARTQTKELIDSLGLGEYSQRYTKKLSGGMLRLTNFAMSLMGRPHFLILDEPTNELDPAKRRLVWDTISNLNKEQGMTCILVTHNVAEAERVLHRVALMKAGKIIRLGTPGELKLVHGGTIWLEIHVRDEDDLVPEVEQQIGLLGIVDHPIAGYYRIALKEDQVAHATDVIVNELGMTNLDDFRLVPPSLEDVYLAIDSAHTSPAKVPPSPTPSLTSREGDKKVM